jgi:hypothetical protein
MGIRRVLLTIPTALLALAALAACSKGSGGSPGVANLGGGAGSASPSATSTDDQYARAVKFAQCMRSKGITNFPDPNPDGGFTMQQRGGPGVDAPLFQSASAACQKATGFGGQGNSKKQQDLFDALLKFSSCMRDHGISNYPDPERGAGGGIIRKPPAGVSTSSPQFQNARKACENLLPSQARGGA